MIALAENVAWGSNPTIYLSFYYEKTRDGTSMKYRTKTVVSPVTGGHYFGYTIEQSLYMEGGLKESTDLKGSSPSQWSSNIEYTSPWYTIPNKVSGTTDITFVIESNGGRSDMYEYNAAVDPAYASVTQSLNSKTVNSIKMNWSSDSTIDYIWYSKDNGANWTAVGSVNASSGSYTITGLSPNTSYNIKTRVRRSGTTLTTDSSALSVTTYQIATISSASNFNHGDNSSVVLANPSGASMTLQMKIGNTQIFSSSASVGTVTHTYTDTELDNIYKLYGTGNSLTVTYIVSITVNSTTYTSSKTCTVTLTGNQKTSYVGSGGKKRAKVYVGVNGSVKRAVVWVGNNNTRKRCI